MRLFVLACFMSAALLAQDQGLRRREIDDTQDFVVKAGTRILVRLTNSVNTKAAQAGDQLYLRTAVPVFVNGRLVVPEGSYATARITEAKRAGKVKGKAELGFRFDTLTLPNGVMRDTNSRPGSVDAAGSLDRTEGKIKGDSATGRDVGTVARTTTAGAGIGGLAGISSGHTGAGIGIGSGAGALAGLIGVLSTRGPDVILHQGTTMELVLDRDLRFTDEELSRRRQQ